MSSVGKALFILINGRANKAKDPVTGKEYAGIYHPSVVKVDGTVTPAHWEGTIFINGMPYTNKAGVRTEPKPVPFKMVAWNSENSKPGSGIADICAKNISPGKEISGSFTLNAFQKRLFIDNVPQVDHAGRQITYPALSFVLDGLPNLGNDAESLILSEINTFRTTGIATPFGTRPAFWNVPTHADVAVWTKIKADRRAAQYIHGAAMYGYSKVMAQAGAAAPQMDNAALLAQLQALIAGGRVKPAPVPEPVAPVASVLPGIDLGDLLTQLQGNPGIDMGQLFAQLQGNASAAALLGNTANVPI